MKCPDCNNNLRVLDSRLIGAKQIRRRYCKKCGYEMYTCETKMDYIEGMMLINDFYKKNWHSRKEAGWQRSTKRGS